MIFEIFKKTGLWILSKIVAFALLVLIIFLIVIYNKYFNSINPADSAIAATRIINSKNKIEDIKKLLAGDVPNISSEPPPLTKEQEARRIERNIEYRKQAVAALPSGAKEEEIERYMLKLRLDELKGRLLPAAASTPTSSIAQ